MFTKNHCEAFSERYETYGQLGAPSLKGIHNVAICCDLLHLMKDIVEAMLKWHVIFATAELICDPSLAILESARTMH